MEETAFDVEAFYARVGATAKERNILRQNLVRGLKDYYTRVYGYDRYGAETIFLLRDRLGQPHIFGFAALRILRDRRISETTKIATARECLAVIDYGNDWGVPYGLFEAVQCLVERDLLPVDELRYVLVVSAGQQDPFRGCEKQRFVSFFDMLVRREDMPSAERAFWGHALVAHHGELPGAAKLIDLLLSCAPINAEHRRELCWAWLNFRQPRLDVPAPPDDGTPTSEFVARHMPFWVAHAPSWPSLHMVRLGLVWLARLGEDPLSLAESYIDHRGAYEEQVLAGVADLLTEQGAGIPQEELRRLIEAGVRKTGHGPTRRRFYRLGAALFGSAYLERAAGDTANSVRQWATRELQREAAETPISKTP